MKYLKLDKKTMVVFDDLDNVVKIVRPERLEDDKAELLAEIERTNNDIQNIDALLNEWSKVEGG